MQVYSERLHVFISSRMSELADVRAILRRELQRLEINAFVYEAAFGAHPNDPEQVSLQEVARTDLFVLVIGDSYGEITEREYDHARELNKPCLVYERLGAGRTDERLNKFLAKLSGPRSVPSRTTFRTADDLVERVAKDVQAWLVREYRHLSARQMSGTEPTRHASQPETNTQRPGPSSKNPLTSGNSSELGASQLQEVIRRYSPKATLVSREVPPLLPHLCDRKAQEADLGAWLENLRSRPYRRPTIIVIHGDEQQCHSEYVDLLRVDLLPRLLGFDRQKDQFESPFIDWPPCGRQSSRIGNWVEQALRKELDLQTATREELVGYLNTRNMFFLETSFHTRDWRAGGAAEFGEFFRYWAAWPPLPANQWLLVCIAVTYSKSDHSWLRWLSSLFGFPKADVKANQNLRTFLGSHIRTLLPQEVELLVLPELGNVEKADAVNWARYVGRKGIVSGGDLEASVKSLFEDRHALPFRHLTIELKQILEKHMANNGA